VILNTPPDPGVNNVIVVVMFDPQPGTPLVHTEGDTVFDAGGSSMFPGGAYQWQPSRFGMLSTNTDQARFLLRGAG
jgi:hypothetical protein